jgi:hypothetical protein
MPIEAATLAPPVKPFEQDVQGLPEELVQASQVAYDTVVMEIPTELGIQLTEQRLQSQVSVLPAPHRKAIKRSSQLLARGSTLEVWPSSSIFSPVELKTQEVEPGLTGGLVTMKRDNPCLVRCQLQVELCQSFAKHTIEAFRIVLILKGADKIIGISYQTSFTSTVFLDDLMEPQVQDVMEVHIGQDG